MLKAKKIIDGSVAPFDFPVFFSFIKKCFGVSPVRTFTSMAVEIENRSAFEIAHQLLTEACNNNQECVRLAYCSINSELVWKHVDEEYKKLGCSYDSFMEALPAASQPAVPQHSFVNFNCLNLLGNHLSLIYQPGTAYIYTAVFP